jgi:pyrimidine operon attenuation protein/uracil phosphoribosyltransferase
MKEAKLYANADAVHEALENLAEAIIADNDVSGPRALVGLHQYGVTVAERLCSIIEKSIGQRPMLGKLDITMYRDDIGVRPTLPAIRETSISFDVDGAEVVLVDDVLSTGRTVRAALDALTDYGRPARIRLAVLVDRGKPEYPIRADYAGMNIDCPATTRVAVEMGEDPSNDRINLEYWSKGKF